MYVENYYKNMKLVEKSIYIYLFIYLFIAGVNSTQIKDSPEKLFERI